MSSEKRSTGMVAAEEHAASSPPLFERFAAASPRTGCQIELQVGYQKGLCLSTLQAGCQKGQYLSMLPAGQKDLWLRVLLQVVRQREMELQACSLQACYRRDCLQIVSYRLSQQVELVSSASRREMVLRSSLERCQIVRTEQAANSCLLAARRIVQCLLVGQHSLGRQRDCCRHQIDYQLQLQAAVQVVIVVLRCRPCQYMLRSRSESD